MGLSLEGPSWQRMAKFTVPGTKTRERVQVGESRCQECALRFRAEREAGSTAVEESLLPLLPSFPSPAPDPPWAGVLQRGLLSWGPGRPVPLQHEMLGQRRCLLFIKYEWHCAVSRNFSGKLIPPKPSGHLPVPERIIIVTGIRTYKACIIFKKSS